MTPMTERLNLRVTLLTAMALTAFAGNSVLCRMALKGGTIDAAGFTAIRLVAGAVTLMVLAGAIRGKTFKSAGGWISAGMLFLYAASFSYAYLSLDTGIGALILFGMVQATMIVGALWQGARPTRMEWTGWLLAVAGFVFLLSPGLTAPSPVGAGLMALAGVGWGVYSLRGRHESDFLASTGSNFVRATPLVLILSAAAFPHLHLSPEGVVLAVLSGAVTSGLGYAVWYAALRGLTAIQAAMVQLSVPVIAAAGGILLLSESPSTRLFLAGSLVLGGICLAVLGRR